MEAQIRRFWPRRKSIKQSTKPEIKDLPKPPVASSGFHYNSSYEATVSGPPPEVGSLPMKPSEHAKPRKSFGHSKAQSAAVLQEFRSVVDKDAHSRARSTGGIQPILLGISRPVTPGSLQREVMEAANGIGTGVSSAPPVPAISLVKAAASLPEPRKAQKFQSVPRRHVDIMSFATASGKQLEAYNEEVAERNLDLVALATKSPTTTNEPKPQYPEEMANRNAATMGYRYKKASPSMQSLLEGYRSNSLNTKTGLNVPAAASQHPYSHEGSAVPSVPNVRSSHNSSLHHSRNGSATSKASNPLPSIPQGVSVEEAERAIPGLNATQFSKSRQETRDDDELNGTYTRYPSNHTDDFLTKAGRLTSPQPLQKFTTRANQGRPIANGHPKEHVHPLYSNPYEAPVVVYMDTSMRIPETKHRQQHSRQTAGGLSQNSKDNRSRKAPASSRTSSTDRYRPPSSRNHARDTSNRTFMDLTEDEPESESQVSSPNDYLDSPVLAQAKTDMLQVHRAQMIASGGYNHQDVLTPPNSAENGESLIQGLQMPSRQPKRWSGAFSDSGSSFNEQPLAFSGVTTVSSVSPASRPISKFNPAAGVSKDTQSREHTSQSSTSRRVPVSDIARSKTTEDGTEQRQSTTSYLGSRDRAKSPVFYVDTASQVNTQQQIHQAAQTPQIIYTSPESLHSADFADPSRSFGVMARDFAPTPSRPSVTNPSATQQKSQSNVEREPFTPREQTRSHLPEQKVQSSVPSEQKSTARRHVGFEKKEKGVLGDVPEIPVINEPPLSPQLDHVDTPQEELTASSFDEVEFARKQAQARAALLRLQMSLEEQYDMSPGRPDSSTQRHVARQILDQTRTPQPEEKKTSHPPTSMYYERKEYQSKAPKNRPTPIRTSSEETTKSISGYTKQGPNSFASTVYDAVTIAPASTRPAMNSHTKSSSAGSASHSYNYAKGTGIMNGNWAASTFPNPPLTPVLPSPSGTEVSLSSFPMPTTAPQSPEQRGRKVEPEPERPRTARMHSTKSSVASVASVYSIPHHMVPARDSSRRDQFEEEPETGAF